MKPLWITTIAVVVLTIAFVAHCFSELHVIERDRTLISEFVMKVHEDQLRFPPSITRLPGRAIMIEMMRFTYEPLPAYLNAFAKLIGRRSMVAIIGIKTYAPALNDSHMRMLQGTKRLRFVEIHNSLVSDIAIADLRSSSKLELVQVLWGETGIPVWDKMLPSRETLLHLTKDCSGAGGSDAGFTCEQLPAR